MHILARNPRSFSGLLSACTVADDLDKNIYIPESTLSTGNLDLTFPF